jgi:hypothetical protein
MLVYKLIYSFPCVQEGLFGSVAGLLFGLFGSVTGLLYLDHGYCHRLNPQSLARQVMDVTEWQPTG